MKWDDLRVFLAVYRQGTFAGAAQELGVDATTVSRRVAALETALGVKLLQRTSRGLMLVEKAGPVAILAEEMERKAREVLRVGTGEPRGTVRLTTVRSYAHHFLIKHLREFRDAYPAIAVDVIHDSAYEDIHRLGADLGIRFFRTGLGPGVPATTEDLIARRLPDVGFGVYGGLEYLANRGDPGDPWALAGHDVILPRRGIEVRFPGEAWQALAEDIGASVMRVEDMDSMVAATKSGFGLACLPIFIADCHEGIRRLGPAELVDTCECWLLFPTELQEVAPVKALKEFLVDLHGRHGATLLGDLGGVPSVRGSRR